MIRWQIIVYIIDGFWSECMKRRSLEKEISMLQINRKLKILSSKEDSIDRNVVC